MRKPSTRPSYVRIRLRTIAFKRGWKRDCSSSSGRQESNNLMSCVGSTGTGSQSTELWPKPRWVGKKLVPIPVLATQDICSHKRRLQGGVVVVNQAPLNGCLL